MGYQRGQDGAILPSRDCPFSSRNKISPKSERVQESFFSQNIFRDSKKIFCDFSVGLKLKNEKTESVNANENKENKNVDEFQTNTKNTKRHEDVECHIINPLLNIF